MEPNKITCFKLNLAKYKTHVIKEQLLKWTSYNKMNQYHGLSYDNLTVVSFNTLEELK